MNTLEFKKRWGKRGLHPAVLLNVQLECDA